MDAAKQFHADVMGVLEVLMIGDPAPDTTEGKVLLALADAVEKYEKSPRSENAPIALFRTRVGDSLEVLDAIREALAGQDKEQIIEMVNGYIDRARADLASLK